MPTGGLLDELGVGNPQYRVKGLRSFKFERLRNGGLNFCDYLPRRLTSDINADPILFEKIKLIVSKCYMHAFNRLVLLYANCR